MEVCKDLLYCSLLYDFKVCLSATESNRQQRQALQDCAVNERNAKHWFQEFRLEDLFFSDESLSGRPQALDIEALQATLPCMH